MTNSETTTPTTEQPPAEGLILGDGLRVTGTEEARAKLYAALALAVAEFPDIPRSKHVKYFSKKANGFIEYDYASYADMRRAVDKPLGAHGVVCAAFPHGMHSYFVTTLLAGYGAEIWSTFQCPRPEGLDMKQLGGFETYLRRYGLQAALGIEGDIDADELPEEDLKMPEPEKTSAAPKNSTKKQSTKPAAPEPKNEPLWTKEDMQAVSSYAAKLGFAGNPQAFLAVVTDILGFEPKRTARNSPQLTKTQATFLLQQLEARLNASTGEAPEDPGDYPNEPEFEDPATEEN